MKLTHSELNRWAVLEGARFMSTVGSGHEMLCLPPGALMAVVSRAVTVIAQASLAKEEEAHLGRAYLMMKESATNGLDVNWMTGEIALPKDSANMVKPK